MEEYQTIKILNNNYHEDGIQKGDIGCILEIYDKNSCEVEFSDENGITYALQVIKSKDFEVIE